MGWLARDAGTRCWPVQRPAELGGYGYISLHVQMQIEDAFSMQTCMHACFGTAPDARQRCQVVLERAWDGCLCVLSACHERRRTRCLACTGRVCFIFQTVRLRCLRDACRVRAYEAGADGARQRVYAGAAPVLCYTGACCLTHLVLSCMQERSKRIATLSVTCSGSVVASMNPDAPGVQRARSTRGWWRNEA